MEFDTERDLFKMAIPNSPPSLRQLSSRQTPAEMHHDELDFPGAILDDYVPSEIINDDSEEDYVTEEDIQLPDPAPSGRSSISSFPSSIVHHDIRPSQTFPQDVMRTPSHSRTGTPMSHILNYKSLSPLATREHITGFRNPSSVRALQMKDELSDNEDLTLGHRQHGSRMSFMSYRIGSTHSTPGKRMSRSLQGSPVKNNSKLRKEFPLVLLHCTLLPSMISIKAKGVNEELMEAIVPEPYKKRWKLLQEKVGKNFEVRERGVLIPHPKEDYDVLEERLLESLELEQAVISNGHFVGRSDSRASAADSGFGSEETSSRGETTDEEVEEARCADCGGYMCGEKRWELKVYAANGLMRSGAWSAAWSEMEKVDVQVSVWLPEDVRREIDSRLDAVIAQEQQLRDEEINGKEKLADDERTREIYGDNVTQKHQEEIDGLHDMAQQARDQHQPMQSQIEQKIPQISTQPQPKDIDLLSASIKYIELLLQDRRNVTILLLGILLIFYGTSSRQQSPIIDTITRPSVNQVYETKIEYLTSTLVSTSTTIAVETSTIVETTQVAEPVTKSILEPTHALEAEAEVTSIGLVELSTASTAPTLSQEPLTNSSEISNTAPLEVSTSVQGIPMMTLEDSVPDPITNAIVIGSQTANTTCHEAVAGEEDNLKLESKDEL